MVILLDMDEVIEDMIHHWVDTLNCVYGTNVAFEDVNEWDMRKAFSTLTEEKIYNPLHLQTFWEGVKLLDGCKEGINELLKAGHEIYIVTSSYPSTIALKANWLKKNLPEIPWQNVIVTSNKSLVKGDVLVDDGIHNFYEGSYRKILFDKPWNRELKGRMLPHNIIRATDWVHILKIIKNIECFSLKQHTNI